ncbi:MAG: glycosyltransferase family 2 protein [Planctomycetota bacterium]
MSLSEEARPLITVAITNFNGERYLPDLLDAVAALTPPPEAVLLVDDRSTDRSLEIVRAHALEVRVLEQEVNAGPGPARNRALDEASTPWVLQLDNDTFPRPDCLAELAAVLEAHPQAAAVQARAVLRHDPKTVHYDGAYLHYAGIPIVRNFHRPLEGLPTEPAPIDSFQGLALLLDREKVLAAGGYDPRFFFYAEDSDLAHRLRLAGNELWLAPRAIALHGEGTEGLSQRGDSYPSRRIFYLSRNRWILILKAYRWRTLVLALPGIALYELAWLVLAGMRGGLGAWLRARWDLLRQLGGVLEDRRRVQAARVLSDREILRADDVVFLPHLSEGSWQATAQRWLNASMRLWWSCIRRWVG